MSMRYLIRWAFVLAATCSFYARAADKVSTFANLPMGDQLEMSFISSGCFHRDAYNLTFRRAAETTASITQNRLELGQLTLNKADVEGLDELVNFYRKNPPGNCTTRNTITISQRHDGEVIATEKYIDGSCATYSMKGVTNISTLIQRLHKLE